MSVLLVANSLPGSTPPTMLCFQPRTGSVGSKRKTTVLPLDENHFGFMQVLEGEIPGWLGGGAALALPACHFLDVFPGDHTHSPPKRIVLYALCEIKPIPL